MLTFAESSATSARQPGAGGNARRAAELASISRSLPKNPITLFSRC
jgi:hypothetical protein